MSCVSECVFPERFSLFGCEMYGGFDLKFLLQGIGIQINLLMNVCDVFKVFKEITTGIKISTKVYSLEPLYISMRFIITNINIKSR